jgi:hypothetical protein
MTGTQAQNVTNITVLTTELTTIIIGYKISESIIPTNKNLKT